jgi:hypothetical protein
MELEKPSISYVIKYIHPCFVYPYPKYAMINNEVSYRLENRLLIKDIRLMGSSKVCGAPYTLPIRPTWPNPVCISPVDAPLTAGAGRLT